LWGLDPAVKRWIRRHGGSTAWVDDVAAEVFTVAWRRLDVVPDGPDAERWLYAVARRSLSNQRRSLDREAKRIERAANDQRRAATNQGADRISFLQAWFSLPREDAEILRLVGWAGIGLDQLADRLGCRRGAAAMRLSRARQRLESLIAA
jgi:RNA polymerase sigma-70 factor (ECF subfamily)